MQSEVLKTSKPLIYSGLLQVVQSCSELFLRLYLPVNKRINKDLFGHLA